MGTLAADIRYAVRSMRRSPGFFCLVIGILGLGMAASVSVFSIVDGVVMRPLPYRDPERLVILRAVSTSPPYDSNGSISYADFDQFTAKARSFEDLAITYRTGWSAVTLTGGSEPEKVQGAFVSPNLFGMFGRSPKVGRTFTAEENRRGERVVVLSEALSILRFGSGEQAIGRDLEIGGVNWRVIGVMPPDFRVPFLNVQLWAPVLSHPEWNDTEEANPQQRQRWDVMARLKAETTLTSAQMEVDAIASQLKAALPEFHKDRLRLVPLREHFTGNVRRAFWVLFSSVAVLLLIACANVGNLLLARAASRNRELAIRAALGAERGRLLQQFVTESMTLCSLAGVAGTALSLALVRLLKAVAPVDTPRLSEVGLDARALLFAIAVSLLAGILLGFASAWKASRQVPREFLNASGRSATDTRESRRVKNLLVAFEFTLAMVLLTGAALFIRSFVAVLDVDLGLRPEHVLTARVSLPGSMQPRQISDFYRRVMQRISMAPGVQAVGSVSNLFFLDERRMHALRQVEGRRPEPVAAWTPLVWSQVSGAYFQAVGIALLRGRYFNEQDRPDSPPVVIVNEAAARRYWPGEDPIGKRLKGFDPRGRNDDWLTVVGLVKDTRNGGLERKPFSQIYEVQAQRGEQAGVLVIRTAGDPARIAATVRALIHETSGDASISSVGTMEQLLDQQKVQRRFQTWLIGAFSAIALALAALGVFAVMHYSVAARTREIGIRMAAGAQPRDILGLVVRDGARLALAGIAAGLLASAWAAETIASMLYEVKPTDPVSFGAATIILGTVALSACYFPARRASQIDPVRALRQE